jgi:hypothetical protein
MEGKYQRFDLGGANCRSMIWKCPYEYEYNPDFKAFIEACKSKDKLLFPKLVSTVADAD